MNLRYRSSHQTAFDTWYHRIVDQTRAAHFHDGCNSRPERSLSPKGSTQRWEPSRSTCCWAYSTNIGIDVLEPTAELRVSFGIIYHDIGGVYHRIEGRVVRETLEQGSDLTESKMNVWVLYRFPRVVDCVGAKMDLPSTHFGTADGPWSDGPAWRSSGYSPGANG